MSQALEDAEAISLLLARNLGDLSEISSKAVEITFRQYTTARKAHVEKILDAGNRMGDTSREVSTPVEIGMYCMLWVLCKWIYGF